MHLHFEISVTKDGDSLVTQDKGINKWMSTNSTYFSDYNTALDTIKKTIQEFILNNGTEKVNIKTILERIKF